ncbi:uncharacterized protein N7511_000688 [Penicillium nucicola]|uniref:uncharacterized protein n=1 Tax=Penicillium nucicola TaxID=1850975 RepID=UPI00254569B5|nr:uncharacterized protein N7511_000688 [Penicillium nucicola]KAJ5775677.1 hypothetical protein N7511_000688 [Penicillium nucicola]
MEPTLPQGLVTMAAMPATKGLRQEKLESAVYKKFWQAYSTSNLASKDQTESRLEHLFWRIWGNKQLWGGLDLHTLDRLILRIKRTPVLLGQKVEVKKPETAVEKEAVSPGICDSGSCSFNSILKKSQPSPAEIPKKPRLAIFTPSGELITRNPSNPPTPIMTESTQEVPTRQNSKKTYLAATRNGRGPRRRPVFSRRKSSQPTTPKTIPPLRRRSEPAGATNATPDSYVELGQLQHMSFRDEGDEDEIVRDIAREIAPKPKPSKPTNPQFDDELAEDDPDLLKAVKPGCVDQGIPFPRGSSLRHPMLAPESFSQVLGPSFNLNSFQAPGGPDLAIPTSEIDAEWSDVDALESTLPVLQPFKKAVSPQESAIEERAKGPSEIESPIVTVSVGNDESLLTHSVGRIRL